MNKFIELLEEKGLKKAFIEDTKTFMVGWIENTLSKCDDELLDAFLEESGNIAKYLTVKKISEDLFK